jgi:hypothetical protein
MFYPDQHDFEQAMAYEMRGVSVPSINEIQHLEKQNVKLQARIKALEEALEDIKYAIKKVEDSTCDYEPGHAYDDIVDIIDKIDE